MYTNLTFGAKSTAVTTALSEFERGLQSSEPDFNALLGDLTQKLKDSGIDQSSTGGRFKIFVTGAGVISDLEKIQQRLSASAQVNSGNKKQSV